MFNRRISFLEKVLFTKHLAVMLKSGITILEALESLESQTRSRYFKSILSSVLADVKNGQSLTVAFGKFPNVFDQFYMSLIEIGETSGTLEKNLEFLSQQLTKEYGLSKKVQGALLYPGVILGATIGVGGFISFFILPKLLDFFSSFQVALPLSTRILLFIAYAVRDYGILILIGIGAAVIGTVFLLRLYPVKYAWHRMQIRLPAIGDLLWYTQLARFCRNFGILLQSGVPIARSLEVTARTLGNVVFSEDVMMLSNKISQGTNLSEAMKTGFHEFPPIVSKMIAVGEKTGKLEEVLLYLGDFYEDEIDDISKNLSTILEPILLVVIGVIVGFVALSIISPIYELTGSIKK